MVKKKKLKSLIVTSLIVLIGALTMTSFAATMINIVNAALIIDSLPSFQSTVGTDVFYCYKITGTGYERKVAVAWGKDPSATPDDTLTIPETLYNDNPSDTEPYTVVAIANSGFHRCDFKYVSLPETIEEIGKGAFAYCEKLADIRIPHLVDTIQPSTFVSCRGLKTITYSENVAAPGATPVYAATSSNEVITRIEDHAFDSCVSLIQFECPKSLVYIGKSAFQNCNKITRFYLPEKSTYGGITIDSYAFADCTSLEWVYFEENLTTVNNYAFVDCKDSMLFHFGYDPTGGEKQNPEFSTYWRRKSLKGDNEAVYPFEEESHSIIRSADGYPGLKIAINTSPILLNSWHSTDESATNTIQLDPGTGGYAVVYQWDNPGKTVRKTGDTFDYYNIGNGNPGDGILTIPHTVTYNGVNYPIKVIAEEAFKGCTDFKEIHFKSATVGESVHGIVQIQKNAFQNCTNVGVIDFEGVTTLKEIGERMFNAYMTKVTSLKLPASLEYIGPYAFANFRNLTVLKFTTADDDTNSRSPSLKVIGNHAFTNISANLTGTNYIHITLPASLDDSAALTASMNSQGSNWAAVGPYAFSSEGNNIKNRIATVTMATSNNSLETSLAPNAFNGSASMVRFTANANLCMIGSNAFASCTSLKEVFFTTARATAHNSSKLYVWGTTNAGTSPSDSIFGGSACPNLVIYLDGAVPGKINSYSEASDSTGKTRWNAEAYDSNSFSTGLGYSENYTGRKIIPTYTSVNFSEINKTSIIYYNPSTGQTLDESPDTSADYFAGLIVFVKVGSKYTVSHYYTNADNAEEEIDLRGITHTHSGGTVNISTNLTSIGPEAFASDRTVANADNQAPCPGKYFILPKSVAKIEERAFFRKASSDNTVSNIEANGVAIVTTDTTSAGNGTPLGGLSDTYANIKSAFSTNKYGYCNIPNVTTIENNAFFNNSFKEVTLSTSLTKIGKDPFHNRYGSKLTNISFVSTNSKFTITSNGIYYTAVAARQSLLFQAQNITGTLTIADGTVAIGPGALANTSYSQINLVSGLTQIYGSAFQNSTSLQTLGIKADNTYDLEYIGAMPYKKSAYKIEKYKYFIGRGAQTEHVDDLSPWGIIDEAHKTSPGPKITVDFIDEGNSKSLWPFTTTTGRTIYGQNNPIGGGTIDNPGTQNENTIMYQIPFETTDTDVLDASNSDIKNAFDFGDYHYTINTNFSTQRNRSAAFEGCTNLKMVDFRSMTSLKKIGHAAFKNCTNLMNTNLGRTYNYYTYDMSTRTLTLSATKTSNVLDLSNCTHLLSIGAEAFAGCTSIEYFHTPFTDGTIYIGSDLNTTFSGITGKVLPNNNITVLVGDKEIRSNNKTHSAFGGLGLHYPSDWQGTNPIYYYAPDGGAKSLYANNTAVNYWTQDLSKDPYGYLLFVGYDAAKDYFDHISDVTWPS